MKRSKSMIAYACAAALLVVSGMANADALKYRKAVMKAIGGHMGSLGQIVKGGVPHKGHMLAHAMALESTLDMVSDAFKTQTSGGKTTATDKIWTDWKGFVAKANDASKAANALVRTIEDDGDIAPAMKGVGKTCGGCHKAFRKKKKR